MSSILNPRLNVPASVVHEYGGKTYRLNGKILSINESAGVCSMSFLVKETGKRTVHHNIPLNKVEINESFLDAVKNYGSKIGRAVTNAINWTIRKIRGFIVPVAGDKLIPVVNAPVNMAIAQANGSLNSESIVLDASPDLRRAAEEAGAAAASKEYDPQITAEERAEITKFWKPYIETIGDPRNEHLSVHECVQLVNRKKKSMNEAIKSLSVSDSLEHIINVNTAELKSMIVDSIKSQCRNKPGKADNNGKVLIIWGAPGIGKTAIVKQAAKIIKEVNVKANMSVLTINAASMMPDEFTLPSIAQTVAGMNTVIDVPKYWMPVFEPSDEMMYDENGKAIGTYTQVINHFFNTGRLVSTSKDLINGDIPDRNGGIVFIDEFSRMNKASQNIIMNLVLDRKYNGKVMANKWAFIGAANRKSDMSEDMQATFTWEDANATRFTNVNFVPTREEWLEWATSKNANGEPNVEPIITDFIKACGDEVWYDAYDFGSRADIKDAAGKSMTSNILVDTETDEFNSIVQGDPKLKEIMSSWNPRTWEAVSNKYRTKYKELTGTDYSVIDGNDPFDEDIFADDPENPVDNQELDRRYNAFYETYKQRIDPQGKLARRNPHNLMLLLQRWLEQVVIPSEHGTNNITVSKFKEFNDYMNVFTPEEINAIWETGSCTFREDAYAAPKSYYDNSQNLKWKTTYVMQDRVFTMLLENYPGGEDAMRNDFLKSIKTASKMKDKVIAPEDIVSAEDFERILNEVFSTEVIKVDADGNELDRRTINLANDLDGDPIDMDTYTSIAKACQSAAKNPQAIKDILANKEGTKKRQRMMYAMAYSYMNTFKMINDGDVFIKRIVNLVKFMTRLIIQVGMEKGSGIQGEVGTRLIGKITADITPDGEEKNASLDSIKNSLFGKLVGPDMIFESYRNIYCSLVYILTNTINASKKVAKETIDSMKKGSKGKNDVDDEY